MAGHTSPNKESLCLYYTGMAGCGEEAPCHTGEGDQ